MNFKKINLHFKIIFIPPDLTFSPHKIKKENLEVEINVVRKDAQMAFISL